MRIMIGVYVQSPGSVAYSEGVRLQPFTFPAHFANLLGLIIASIVSSLLKNILLVEVHSEPCPTRLD